MGVRFFNERNNTGAQLDWCDLAGRIAFLPKKSQIGRFENVNHTRATHFSS